MATNGDKFDDSFSFGWGSTPESQKLDALWTRAYHAIENDDGAEIQRLAIEEPGWIGGTVFHDAVRYGSRNCVAALLALGNSANEPDEGGATPLMYAAQANLELVQMLIAAGADPNVLAEDNDPEIDADCHGQSALFWAVLAGRTDVAHYLAPLTRVELRDRVPEVLQRRREQEARWID
jgi:hypothetical protein